MGIDYGRFPMANGSLPNRDERGIRYGIISVHKLADWIYDEAEAEYFFGCGHCGTELDPNDDSLFPGEFESGECPHCAEKIRRDDCHGDEPLAWIIDTDGVKGHIDTGGDVWIHHSPWIARGSHASPCAPGAVTFNGRPDVTVRYNRDDAGAMRAQPIAYTVPREWWRDSDEE